MVTIREEKIADVAAREALLDEAYGACRFTKTSERLREGRRPVDGLSLVAVERGRVVGTVRLWHVAAGPGCAALLLGPLAVHPDYRNRGIGTTLVRRAFARARLAGHGAIRSGRRCALLQPFRLQRGADRRSMDARKLRARPAARPGTEAGRTCRRSRDDRRHRRACAKARSQRTDRGKWRGASRYCTTRRLKLDL